MVKLLEKRCSQEESQTLKKEQKSTQDIHFYSLYSPANDIGNLDQLCRSAFTLVNSLLIVVLSRMANGSIARANNRGDSGHPWRVPLDRGKYVEYCLFVLTWARSDE